MGFTVTSLSPQKASFAPCLHPQELLGVSFLELVDPNDSQEVLRSVLATLRRGGIRQASV